MLTATTAWSNEVWHVAKINMNYYTTAQHTAKLLAITISICI